MNFIEKLLAVWQNVSIVHRVLLVAVLLTLTIVGALIVYWARKPDMRILYRELSPEEASKITEKISEKGIPYELGTGGTSISVPKEKVYQLRLDMAREGLPANQQGGYAIFDNEKIGISPFVQNINLQRALQEELAKSIQMIDGVDHARVHIVNTEQKFLASDSTQTSASVVLRLRAGYKLSSFNIAAITHLVAGSVEGLKSERVTVVDSQGHLLSGESEQGYASGVGTVQDYRERIEQNLSQKVEDMLEAVLGPDRASVRVSAVIDMNSVSTVTETYQPKGAVSKEEITKSTEPTGAATADPAVQPTPKKMEEISTEYELGKTVKQETILPGKIVSLKVAAFVDLSADVSDANDSAAGASAKIMQVTDVEEIIKNALGLEDATSIKVVDVKFNRPLGSIMEEEASSWPQYLAIVRHASLGIMAICALLVFKIFRGAHKKSAIDVAGAGQLPQGSDASGLLPAGVGVQEPVAVRRQIASALQKNPEQVKQLFASWIEEKG